MDDDYLKLLEYTTDCKKFMEDILDLEIKDFHEGWIDLFEKNRFVCLLAPRAHGKSTIVEGYIIWKILMNPKIRILIVTVNQNKAEEMMSFIRQHLANNEKIINIFGKQKSPLWSNSKLRVKNRGGGRVHKEPTLQVLGVTSSQISSHYDMILLDDVCDRKNVRTASRRKKLKNWYETELLEMLEPNGQLINIGTLWNADDLHNYLMEKNAFAVEKYQAIINDEEEEVLWPGRYSYNELQNLRDEHIGKTAFDLQYQNKITQTEDSPIDKEWVEKAMFRWDKSTIPQNCKRYIGVDIASRSSKGDYFCASVVAKDDDNNYYVVESIRDKISMSKQLEIIKSLFKKWSPRKIGVESNAAQRIIADEWEESTNLPFEQLKSSWINDKWSRTQKLSVLLETNRLTINPNLDFLAEELINFPRGKHDDALDSVSFAIQTSEKERNIDWKRVTDVVSAKKRKPYVHKI